MGDGPPGFRRNFSCSAVLRILVELIWISHTGLLPYVAQLSSWLLLSIAVSCPSPTTPKSKLFGLGFSDFARHYSRNHFCFLFLWVLRCFTSPRSRLLPYFIQARVTGHNSSRVSPFGHPRITARLAAPRGFSQPPTSFFGS